ncbi:MAG: class I SAM-dependent methyltransferase [Coleofasciculus sp. S288]|nr:class I SAM-dependent methyltransferase [Coleofasciculus sp. S288]
MLTSDRIKLTSKAELKHLKSQLLHAQSGSEQLKSQLLHTEAELESLKNSSLDFHGLRRTIAFRYLVGTGLEIGALHQPLEVSTQATVRYVDRMHVDELRRHYPELAAYNLVEPDVLDDGETLSSISDDSVDFVIANHMIEHCQNPIGAIENFVRVLKPDGILYMAVPDKRYIFDRDRPVTPLEHLIRDYQEGPEWSMYSHFEEFVRLVNKVPEHEVSKQAQHLININYSIHFHVWQGLDFLELVSYCQKELDFPLEIELFQKNGFEFIIILKKAS